MSHHIPAVSWDQGARAVARRRHRPPWTPRPRLFLLATIDHYLSEDVHAMMPVPHYSSSAMDGYAVAGNPPWRLVRPSYPEDSRANIHRLTVPISPGEATPDSNRRPDSRRHRGHRARGAHQQLRGSRFLASADTRASIHYLEMAEDLNRPPRNRYSFRRRGATAR